MNFFWVVVLHEFSFVNGNGYCLNDPKDPDDPHKTCYCPYKYPTPKLVTCKQGKQCEKYVINNFYIISSHKLTIAKSLKGLLDLIIGKNHVERENAIYMIKSINGG